ncbi:MAG: aminotransferase class I/II-fold pyridoxal phosphate-dependent enzyme, partial [Eubacteriales bacterium]|nr:aminotransferase class I/II-fold pyridoxal phosphate-dependent enzyme [Eubacteriales bacterium]
MIKLVNPYIAPREEMMPAIEKVLYSGYIAVGEQVKEFEDDLGNYIENKNILTVNSGTAALHIALLLLNIGTGDEVISTPMTSEPTNTAIYMTGAKVVWADVDLNNGLIDPKSIEEKITEHTKAIMVVHYAGMVCDMDKINEISKKYNIPVIEDNAHGLYSKYNGKPVGKNSKYTCFSFQAIKHLTTIDGGAISFLDDKEIEEAKELRWFGLQKTVSRLETDIKRV